jgi:hypothetical protein
MDIKKEILKLRSKSQIINIVKYIGAHADRFNILVTNYLNGPYQVSQRASWAISHCVENRPELIKPHLKKVLHFASKPGVHDSVKRNTMRLLQFIEIPKKYQGHVVELAFHFLQNKKEPIAVKAFSMTVLSRLIKNEPDLKKELRLIIEDQIPFSSPGFKSRAKKVLTELSQNV